VPETALTFLFADMGPPAPTGGGTGAPAGGPPGGPAFESALLGTSARPFPVPGRPGVRAAAFRVAGEAARVALRLAPARCALHRGDARAAAGAYAGPGVDTTAALHDMADGGQVLVTAGAATLVSAALPAGASLVYQGGRQLGADPYPTRVY
jgi:class 3 adenylate cyclase